MGETRRLELDMNSAREDLKDFFNESLRRRVLEQMSFFVFYMRPLTCSRI
jgi:hypothetical protein